MIDFGPDVLHDFERASQLEWLETNGLGGWASSSITFANTRRFHGSDAALPYVHISVPGATFEAQPNRWNNFVYDRERERGLDFEEDLFTPGSYVVTLRRGDLLPVVLATEDREWDALAMIEEERQ